MGQRTEDQSLAQARHELGDLLNKDKMHEPVSTLEVILLRI